MRRLVLIVTCIAALGVGAAAWISSAGASVAHRAAPRIGQLSIPTLTVPQPIPRAMTVPQPIPQTCYVAGGGCSLHPCVEFASPDAVHQLSAAGILPGSAARMKCRPTGSGLARVSVGVVSAQAVK